jgi:hypothetical protein
MDRWQLRGERLSANVFCGFGHELFKQRFEMVVQMQFFTFPLEQLSLSSGRIVDTRDASATMRGRRLDRCGCGK